MDEIETIKPPERPKIEEKPLGKDGKVRFGDQIVNLPFHLKIRKKWLYYLILPLFVLLVLFFGLVQQGIVGSWIDSYKSASVSLTVLDQDSAPVDNAQVIFTDASSPTDASGVANVSELISGKQTMLIRKTGFESFSQDVTLKRGHNSLGTFKLTATTAKKVNLTINITSYISEVPIKTASVLLKDIKAMLVGSLWQFNDVPVGDYTLSVTAPNFITHTANVTIGDNTTALDSVTLVPSGTVVFESNRDQGLRGIYTSNYDGSSQKLLIPRVGSFEDYSPSLDPSQKKVFFFSTRDGVKKDDNSGSYKEAIYLVNLDGTGLTKIFDDAESYNARWSPSGGLISFLSSYNSNNQGNVLKIYNVSSKQTASFDAYVDINSSSVAISGDNNTVAFSGHVKTTNADGFFTANTDGNNVKTIENLAVYSSEFASTGRLRYNYYDSAANKTRYFEYDPSTSAKSEISAPAIDKVGATLSPDKKLRAYVSTRDGKANLFISGADGKNEVQLTTLNSVTGNLLWSLDSSFIMFDLQKSGESARYLVSINGTAAAKKIVDINAGNWY